MNQSEVTTAALIMLERRGRVVMEKAKQEILNTTYYDNGTIASALRYYAKNKLPLVKPIFPALMSLSYGAVKGGQETSNFESVASAMALLAFSADIHDDIIDKSDVKYGKKTVYGKFGVEISLLAGDALLTQGNTLLHQTCENLSQKQRRAISDLITKTLFEISSAEALAIKLRKKTTINPDEYFEIIRLKGVVPESNCKIGGIIGEASNSVLDALSSYGRTIGMLGIIGSEFNDMFNISEFEHRIKFECLPLPVMYAIQDKEIKTIIDDFVRQNKYSKIHVKKIVKLVLESEGIYRLKQKIYDQINQERNNWILTKKSKAEQDASLLFRLFSDIFANLFTNHPNI